MLSAVEARSLLEPFRVDISPDEMKTLLTYLDLLLRWNLKINLTSIRDPQECVRRNFGESLYLSRFTKLKGRLLDIGSGAGFPGLALKIVSPSLSVTLLEPNGKKRAFLKEVVRECEMKLVGVGRERLEEFIDQESRRDFDLVTARALGRLEGVVPMALECLKPGGRICLWVSNAQSKALTQIRGIKWQPAECIPLSRQRQIQIGDLSSAG